MSEDTFTTLRTFTGKENHMNSSVVAEVYLMPIQEVETPLWSASRTVQHGQRVQMLGVGARVPSIHNVQEQIGGCWRSNQYQIADGEILKFSVRRKTGWDGVPKQASIYVKMRHGAAMLSIKADTLKVPHQSTRDFVEVAGRFDVIQLHEVLAAGRQVHRFGHFQSAAKLVEECFDITELEPERAPRIVVQTVSVTAQDGSVKAMPVVQPRRAIRLRH